MSWLSKGLKKVAKVAVKAAGLAFKSTPIGLAAGAVQTLIGGGGGGAPSMALTTAPQWNPPGIQLPGGVTLDLPGFGRPGFGIGPTGARRGRVQAGPKGECPKGYHLNKSKTPDGLPAKSFCVRNRHVNYANGRAARRAGRRVKGTVRLLRRSFTLVAAKAPKGKWIPKGGRKR